MCLFQQLRHPQYVRITNTSRRTRVLREGPGCWQGCQASCSIVWSAVDLIIDIAHGCQDEARVTQRCEWESGPAGIEASLYPATQLIGRGESREGERDWQDPHCLFIRGHFEQTHAVYQKKAPTTTYFLVGKKQTLQCQNGGMLFFSVLPMCFRFYIAAPVTFSLSSSQNQKQAVLYYGRSGCVRSLCG